MTTAEAILNVLREAGANGVSTHEFTYQHQIQQAPRRIHDLRARGYEIETVPRRGLTAVFVLNSEPGTVKAVRCPDCDRPLDNVRQTISADVVNGQCLTHGSQLVVIR